MGCLCFLIQHSISAVTCQFFPATSNPDKKKIIFVEKEKYGCYNLNNYRKVGESAFSVSEKFIRSGREEGKKRAACVELDVRKGSREGRQNEEYQIKKNNAKKRRREYEV